MLKSIVRMEKKKANETINVTPDSIFFRDVACGDSDSVDMWIHNFGKKPVSIRLKMPADSPFSLSTSSLPMAAPGLETKITISYTAKSNEPVKSKVFVCSDESNILVPITAFPPCPRITPEKTRIDLGTVGINTDFKFSFSLSNMGTTEGKVKLSSTENSLTFMPSESLILPSKTVEIGCNFKPQKEGNYSFSIKPEVEDAFEQCPPIEICYKAISQSLALMINDKEITEFNFETIYYGQKRVITANLINRSPFKQSFVVLPPRNAQQDSKETVFTAVPSEGLLSPRGSSVIRFVFNPPIEKKQEEDSEISYNQYATIEVVETSQKIEFQMIGKAVHHLISLSSIDFNFERTLEKQKSTQKLTIKNESHFLSTNFEIKPVAQFKFEPAKASLKVGQSVDVNIIFYPKNLGTFELATLITFCGGLSKKRINLSGSCDEEEKPFKRVPIYETDQETRFNAMHPDTRFAYDLNEIKKNEEKRAKNDAYLVELEEKHAEQIRKKEFNAKIKKDAESFLSRTVGNYTDEDVKEFIQTKLADEDYMKKFSSENNEKSDNKNETTKNRKRNKEAENGLVPPDPPLRVRKKEPLFIPNPSKFGLISNSTENGDDKNGFNNSKNEFQDENVLIKRKFKSKASTPVGVNECTRPLTPAQQLLVRASHQTINFGEISIFSQSTKSFSIHNGLQQHILVTLKYEYEEVKDSFPVSQVIPAGQIGGFDIKFTSTKQQNFMKTLQYTINGHHTYAINICATVVPINVQLSRSLIDFRFTPDSNLPIIREHVTLFNKSNSNAEFNWTNVTPPFSIEKQSGVVEANKSMSIEIVYRPTTKSRDELSIICEVNGGYSRTLKCVGEVGCPRISLVKKTVNFGLIPIGIEKSLQFRVKNSGEDDAIFTIDVPSNSPELRIQPRNGKICAKDSIYLNVTYRAISAHSFDVPVSISVCGTQKLSFNVTGQSELPDVQVCTTEFDFGRVYVGSSASIETQISNGSKIPAILVLDFSRHPDFRIEFSSNLADEFGEERANFISLVSDQTFITRMEANRSEYASDQNKDESTASSSMSSISSFSSSLTDDKAKKKKKKNENSEKGLIYEIKLAEESTIDLCLVFQPTEVADHSFELPMTLLNVPSSSSSIKLQPIVSAEGIEAPIVMSNTQIDFGIKPIHDPLNPNCPASKQQIRLTCESIETINWRIEINGTNQKENEESCFVVTPNEGVLNPSQFELVKIQFLPKCAIPYNSYLSLFAFSSEGDKEEENLIAKAQITGVGSSEMFKPSFHEVCMPIVPLNTKSQMSISIINVGKIQSNLKTQIPVDENAFPVKISFPKGNQLLHTTEELPLNISFCSPKPLSFTTVVAVVDDLGNATSFILTCTTDNSIFTLYPYLTNSNKPTKSQVFSKDFLESAEIQSRFLTLSDVIDLKGKNWTNNSFSPVVISFFKRYLNMLVLSSQLNEFPDDLINSQGSLIIEALTNLAGGKKQQQSLSSTMNENLSETQKKKNSSLSENSESSSIESISNRRNNFKNLINKLQSFGALLSSIRPEFLMKKNDFMQLMKLKVTKQILGIDYFGAPDISSFDQTVLMELKSSKSFSNSLLARLDVLETVYERLSIECWMTVILQVVKLFVIARVDPDRMGKVAGYQEAVKQAKAILSKQPNGNEIFNEINKNSKSLQSYPTMSVQELSLLKWITINYVKSGGDVKRKFADFTSLQDSIGFSYLVRSHSTMFHAVLNENATSKSQIESNASEFIGALKKLQLPFLPKVAEIIDGSQCILATICEYFYETLPHYLSSASLEFNTSLHKPITKAISLTNPSKNEIVYSATIEGDKNFALQQDFATVGPGQTVDFNVSFLARTTKKVTGRITLIPSKPRIVTQRSNVTLNQTENRDSALSTSREKNTAKGLPMYSVPVVVEITSSVAVSGPDEVFNFETNVYSPKTLTIPVKNHLEINGLRYQIYIKVEKIQDENGKQINGTKNVVGTIESFINNPSEECQKMPSSESNDFASLITSHSTFIVRMKEIVFDSNESRSIEVEFVPIELGTYRCLILFKNEKEGEFIYEIDAKSTLPTPIDFGGSKIKTEAGKVFTFNVPVEQENQGLLRALSYSLIKNTDVSEWKFKDMVNRKVHELESIFRKSFESRLFTVLSSSQYFETQNEMNVISSSDKNILNVSFKPIKAGEYPCKIVLLSTTDIRVYHIKGIGLSATKELLLEFQTTFGKSLKQEIPFINPTDDVWQLKINIKGDSSFTSPSHLNVKPKSQSQLSITFNPIKIGTFSADMTVNNITKEAITIYKLIAKVDEPPAEDKIIVDCQARQDTTKTFLVKPFIKNGQIEVTSTVPMIQFNNEIEFQEGKEAEFSFSIYAPRSGVSAGTITFTDPQTGNFIWYIIEIHIDPPAPEGTIDVDTEVRKNVTVPIPIDNNHSFAVKYKVTLSNEEELHGMDEFIAPPNYKSTYSLIVASIKEAEKEESIRFYSEDGGEFWYKLKIKAQPPQGQILAPLTASIGKTASAFVLIENLASKTAFYEVENDNANAFQVLVKKNFQLLTNEGKKVELRYTPTVVGVKENARIVFKSNENSDYEFYLTGTGKPPQPLSPTIVTASVNSPNSALILFTNPFSYPSRFSISLNSDRGNVFKFLIKKLVFTLCSYGEEYQIPFTFTPDALGQFKGNIVVSSLGPSKGPLPDLESMPSIRWVYPIIGNSTETGQIESHQLKSKAQQSITQNMTFTLVGESESFEINEYKILLDLPSSLDFIRTILELKPEQIEKINNNVKLTVKANFSPQRPFNQSINVVIQNPMGQEWKFPLELNVDLGKPCDSIVIESLLNKAGIGKIKIPARFREKTPFHVYFAAGSASEFSLTDSHGMIDPTTQDNCELPVDVVFEPKMYGKILKGLIIVDTLDSQFLFDVVGKTPDYIPPVAKKSNIDGLNPKRGSGLRNVIKDNSDGVKITKPKLDQK